MKGRRPGRHDQAESQLWRQKRDDMMFGSLFSGIGGIEIGLERAGMACKWQVEIDDYCNKVLAKHWPNVKRYRDVRETGRHNLEPVDLICGGYPCQPFSQAGLRKGAADDRHLWPEMFRVIQELRPNWVLGENVAGHVSLGLDNVLSDLESEGYSTRPFVVPACAVDAPHRRDRVWIVANRPGEQGYGGDSGVSGEGKRKFRGSGRGSDLANAHVPRPQGHRGLCERSSEQSFGARGEPLCPSWLPEPAVGRVANGVPKRVDRLRCLGNAVVPQVVEVIGRAIVYAHERMCHV